jgi:RNA polymerase sigma-70 factor, ECF subfamily
MALNSLDIERQVREAVAATDFRLAATRALTELGGEILRFLRARLRDRQQAEEAYLQFSEDLWIGLPAFRWESSLRVWMFVLARNAATRVSRGRRREVALGSDEQGYSELHMRLRTATARFMQTAIKDRMREIRQRLDEDEQTLLILRVDRALEWRELAVVMNEVASDASEEEIVRASARLRTRFQSAKKRLRALAEEEGLLRRKTEDGPT